MRSLAELLFDWGYFRQAQGAVKTSFLSWYYEATQSERIQNGLEASNPELIELAIKSANQAEKFDQENRVSEIVRIMEDYEQRADDLINYVAFLAILVVGSAAATDLLRFVDLFSSVAIQLVAGIFSVSSLLVYTSYRVIVHQIKSNSELIKKFNKELTERPGDVRKKDQDWNWLAAQVFWNRSLLSPSTHVCILLLSIIRLISPRTFGYISGDLRDEIQDFVSMNSRQIIRHQTKKVTDAIRPHWTVRE